MTVMANQCVSCGANIPEGDHICDKCKADTYNPIANRIEFENAKQEFCYALKETPLYKFAMFLLRLDKRLSDLRR